MSKGYNERLLAISLSCLLFFWSVQPVLAGPYFYITGTHSGEFASVSSWIVKLNTDSSTLTATQTVINFDSSLFGAIQINNLNSRCSFWAPPEPSLGFGKWVTPYFMDYDKVVFSCGFSSPGYVTSGEGDFILSFTLRPLFVGTTQFTFSDSQHRYIDSTITPGTDLSFDYESIATIEATVVIGATVSAPTASPTPIPVDTLKVDDLRMVDYTKSLSKRVGSAAYGLLSPGLGLVPLDDTVPPPPTDLPLRPKATPYPQASGSAANKNEGEVLSIQSLRELLIPGKSDADKRLVAFNLIALLTFIALLAALIWRLVTSSRVNKVKYRHMKELLEGEISVIQSKLAGVQSGSGSNEDVIRSLEELRSELEKQK